MFPLAMRRRSIVLLRSIALAVALCAPLSAKADGVYRYTEPDGTIVYTNRPPPGRKAHRLPGSSFRPAPRPGDPVNAKPDIASAFDLHVDAAAHKYNIPAALVRAVMHAESGFNPRAVSNKGAAGLMQLMPDTAQNLYVRDIFDERDNIEGGTRYLRLLANMFDGDMIKMVAAYNAGPEAVKRYGGKVPPFPETQAYVQKVVQLYYQYKQQLSFAKAGP